MSLWQARVNRQCRSLQKRRVGIRETQFNPEDSPEGTEERISMLKQENGCLCKKCFYVKRGSCGNMKVCELVNSLESNEAFADKQGSWLTSLGPITVLVLECWFEAASFVSLLRFARMRKAFVEFSAAHPGRKFRHEKPDLKILLERKEETYIDVSQADAARAVFTTQNLSYIIYRLCNM